MKRILLALNEERASTAEGFDEVFLWTDQPQSSFSSNLSPSLTKLGPVTDANADFVRIATAVYAADRSVHRQGQGSNWNKRNFELTVPVVNVAAWQSVSPRLSEVIGFLTGDRWTFLFEATKPGATQATFLANQSTRCVLLSGGADSATGALVSQHQIASAERHTLVSHYSQTALKPVQQNLVTRLGELLPDREITHHQIRMARSTTRLDGTQYQNETSTRSRSLLFLSLGLASASTSGLPLWIPENGFASLNPPLGPERRGSLTTKTTHPRFLHDLSAVLSDAGAQAEILNPFSTMTKGEMFRHVADLIGANAASEYLSATNSCSHTDARFDGGKPGSSCGVCFGCIVRRASFKAAKLEDLTDYLSDNATGRIKDFVDGKSIEIAMRDFVSRGVSQQVVWAMELPQGYTARQAYELCQRGVSELGDYLQ